MKYCKDCGKQIDKRSTRCRQCSNILITRKLKKFNYCIDCGKEISRNRKAKRCQSCAGKEKMKNLISNLYIDGRSKIKNYCIDCKKEITRLATKCKSCARKGKTIRWLLESKLKQSIKLQGQHHSPATEFKKGDNLGSKSYFWKGGITDLNKWIRKLTISKEWIKEIFNHDNYTCQECGKRGCVLEAHHIKPFSIILEEFLNFYNQFSPLEDKETLVRLSESYEPFWDLNNGKTLCYECHNKLPKFGGRPCDLLK